MSKAVIVGCLVVASLFGLLAGYTFCFVTIPAGHVGVLDWFGNVQEETLPAGPHLVNPLKKVTRMSCQTIKDEEDASVPTKKGMIVGLKAVLLYRLDATKAAQMKREVGSDYGEKLVKTTFRNAVRDAIANFDAEALYTAEREQVESKVRELVGRELGVRGLIMENVMLLDPVLPAAVTTSINAKIAQEQEAAAMQYVLQKKRLEAEAKVVEAEGIAKSQKIVKADLDDNYL